MSNELITLTITTDFMGMPQTVHPVLLKGEVGWFLVDCGYVGSLPLIERELEHHRIAVEDITHILITHQDHDHVGAAAAFKAAHPKVKILASAQEAPYISGEKKSLRLMQAEEMQKHLPDDQKAFGEAFCRVLRSVEPIAVDQIVADGDRLPFGGACTVVATPGHTPGHISLHLPEQSTIITGDAAALENGERVIANPQFTLDMQRAS